MEKEVPNFVRNQFLTADMLNDLVRFTEDQTRQIKTDFIGSGVISGLDVSAEMKNGEPILRLSQGEALTPSGQSVKIQKDELYGFYFDKQGAEKTEWLRRLGLSSTQGEGDLWVLVDTQKEDAISFGEKKNESSNTPLEEVPQEEMNLAVFKGKILLLLVEEEVVENRQPIFSLASAGAKKQMVVRKVLIDESLLGDTVNERAPSNRINPARDFLKVPLPRFGWKNGRMQLETIQSFEEYYFFYQEMIRNLADQLAERLQEAHDKIAAALSLPTEKSFSEFKEAVDIEIEEKKFPDFQYLYDFLKDIALIYNQVCEIDVDLTTGEEETATPISRNFLLLGAVLSESTLAGGRQHFQPSKVKRQEQGVSSTDMRILYEQIELLTKVIDGRLVAYQSPLIEDKNFSAQNVKLTANQSIVPCYYNREISQMTEVRQKKGNEGGAEFQGLSTNIAAQTFYRIEGHVGLPATDVMNALAVKRRFFSLPFQLVLVHIEIEEQEREEPSLLDRFFRLRRAEETSSTNLSFFSSFVKKYTGLQHGKGVTAGGTFIVVATKGRNLEQFLAFGEERFQAEKSYVVGDFYVPHFIESQSTWKDFRFTETARPFIQIAKQRFRAKDTNRYEFVVHPLGGQLNGPSSGIIQEGERFFFKPDKAFEGEGNGESSVTYTYTIEGKESTVFLQMD